MGQSQGRPRPQSVRLGGASLMRWGYLIDRPTYVASLSVPLLSRRKVWFGQFLVLFIVTTSGSGWNQFGLVPIDRKLYRPADPLFSSVGLLPGQGVSGFSLWTLSAASLPAHVFLPNIPNTSHSLNIKFLSCCDMSPITKCSLSKACILTFRFCHLLLELIQTSFL